MGAPGRQGRGRADDGRATIRDEAAEAARHYRTSFAESQDPLASLLRDLGGTVGWVTGRFTRGAGEDDSPPPPT